MIAELKSKVEDFFQSSKSGRYFIIMQIMSNYFTNYAIVLIYTTITHVESAEHNQRTQKRQHTPHNFINCDKLIIIYE